MDGSRRLLLVRAAFLFSLCCALIPSAVLARSELLWIVPTGMILFTAAMGWWLCGFVHRQGGSIGWFVSAAMVVLLLVCPEFVLRAIRFRYETGVEFGYPRPHDMLAFVPDERLFWKMPPDTEKTNSLGFPGREVEMPKPPDLTRLLFLGDSCTWHGFPWDVEKQLRSRRRDLSRRFESVVLAVPGYSSYQGRVLADLFGAEFQPDVVFVYFGWNDHWRAYGVPDAEKAAAQHGGRMSWPTALHRVYHNVRLLQGLARLADSWGGRDEPSDRVRVPVDQYRENLVHIGEVFDEQNVPVVMITAPTSHDSTGVPDRLIDLGFAPDSETVIRLHREYNRVVRQVCFDRGWHLLDLAAQYRQQHDPDAIFMEDGIHFKDSWLPRVAEDVVTFLLHRNLISL